MGAGGFFMIGDKIIIWTIRFILIAMYMIFGYLLISTAFSDRLTISAAEYGQVMGVVLSDIIDSGELEPDAFAPGYLDARYDGAYGFRIAFDPDAPDEDTIVAIYNEQFFSIRYPIAGAGKSEYIKYDGKTPARLNGKPGTLIFNYVTVR